MNNIFHINAIAFFVFGAYLFVYFLSLFLTSDKQIIPLFPKKLCIVGRRN